MNDKQYKTDENLNARKRLHENYSVQKEEWNEWLFRKLKLKTGDCVLEVGCGNGQLWPDNETKIPSDISIVLTDTSEGMIEKVRTTFQTNNISTEVADVQSLPFEEDTFDLVVASHMLYHVSNLDNALKEIHRVLKPGGRLIASGFGRKNFAELNQLIEDIAPEIKYKDMQESVLATFNLDDHITNISEIFGTLCRINYEDEIRVDHEKPLSDYILSFVSKKDSDLETKVRINVRAYFESYKTFVITKDVGIIEALKV